MDGDSTCEEEDQDIVDHCDQQYVDNKYNIETEAPQQTSDDQDNVETEVSQQTSKQSDTSAEDHISITSGEEEVETPQQQEETQPPDQPDEQNTPVPCKWGSFLCFPHFYLLTSLSSYFSGELFRRGEGCTCSGIDHTTDNNNKKYNTGGTCHTIYKLGL